MTHNMKKYEKLGHLIGEFINTSTSLMTASTLVGKVDGIEYALSRINFRDADGSRISRDELVKVLNKERDVLLNNIKQG